MPVRVRTQVAEADVEDVVESLFSASNTLHDLGLWGISCGIPGNILGKESIEVSGSPVIKKAFDGVFKVDSDGYCDFGKVYSSVSTGYFRKAEVAFYYAPETGVPVVAKVMHTQYTFPPKDISSALFFLLNKSAEKEAIKLTKKALIQGEGEGLEVYLATKQRVAYATRNLRADIPAINDIYSNELDTYGCFYVDNHPSVKVFGHIEAFSKGKDDLGYHVKLRAGGGREHVYYTLEYGDMRNAMTLLLEKFVPKTEYPAIRKLAEKVRAKAVETYLLLSVLRRLDGSIG